MGIANGAVMRAQAQLCDRIDRLAIEVPHLSVSRLAHEVDQLRRIATDYGLSPVADIARGLERALAGSEGGVVIMPFLEAMRDAVGCERLDAATSRTYLAAINQRLYG